MRWVALAAGAALLLVAFLAGNRVADTREGLVFEVITLLAGLAGLVLFLYGWMAAMARTHAVPTRTSVEAPSANTVRSANELLIGGGGLTVAAILVIGIGLSAGPLWAVLGLVLLLPMVAGSAFLCLRFLRASRREWKIDLQRLTRRGD
jgi:hypothetical protein